MRWGKMPGPLLRLPAALPQAFTARALDGPQPERPRVGWVNWTRHRPGGEAQRRPRPGKAVRGRTSYGFSQSRFYPPTKSAILKSWRHSRHRCEETDGLAALSWPNL